MAKNGIRNEKSAFALLAEQLRAASKAPNVYGYKPHEKQAEFHGSPARGRQFIGGNRSGKTVAGAVEAVLWATNKHPWLQTPEPPVRGRVVSVDFLQGVEKIVKPEIAKWLPKSEIKGGSWETGYSRELRTLYLQNGSFIEFMSYDQDLEKFAGTSRHFTWFDEEPPEDIFTECKLRLLDTGGSWWMTMTPVEGMTWTFDNIYTKARVDPQLHVVEVDTTDNVYLNPGEIEAIASGLSQEDKEARLHGKYLQRTGLIYKHFGEHHILDPFIPSKEWLWVAGMDHGFNNPTAWLWVAVNPDGNIVVFDEHYETERIVKYHASVVKAKNEFHGKIPDYNVGDPSIKNVDPLTGTSILLEYMEHGVPILLGNNDVQAGIQRVARYLGEPPYGPANKPRLYVTRNCVNTIWEFDRYRWGRFVHKKVANERNKKEEPTKKDDHAMDALRYLVASRPEMDDGKTLPEQNWEHLNNFVGASKAVDPAERFDEGLTKAPRRGDYSDVDFTLGAEW